FSEPSSADAADRLFAQALRRARGKVVLAATSAMGSGNETVRGPIAELADAAQWGVLAAPGGTDLVVRRHGSLTGHPSAAARVAQLFGVIFTNALTARWLNYYAPEMAL